MPNERKTGLARALRTNNTPSEKVLWHSVRARRFLGLKFRRQVPIGPYILDFYCDEHKLGVEIDGGTHPFRSSYEQAREEFMKSQGLRVLHVRNWDALNNLPGVLFRIAEACGLSIAGNENNL